MSIQVILLDDEALITDLLSNFLQQDPAIEVKGTYNFGVAFLEAMQEATTLPDLFIIDYRIGDTDGLELLKRLRALDIQTPVILLSSHYNDSLISFIVKTGFAAFLPKNMKPSILIEVIHEVHNKGFYLLPAQFEHLREQMQVKNQPLTTDLKIALTEREVEVLHLIAQQKTGKEIADQLFISLKTVEGHKNSLFLKTGAKNIVGLIVYAVQNKLISLDEISMY
ncbi:DNA-binding NarL/FixJ family response regulator [Myroides gitamensis]|uniref:response regulator transcription factor n=1 Tax=Myroides odoratus TaxID=256 RepID=UPI0021696EB4|nr:response regulator transcription factor [Myroides odoratus]MCS4238224.1 DNA-binding NarL/FixJ family response regulator [Myroides odoratus]MDH6600975.1 DNA-binding NarL/FixJ family response regulator [Myroides gitamensis]